MKPRDGVRSLSISRFGWLCAVSMSMGLVACGGGGLAAPLADPSLPPAWDALEMMTSTAGSFQVSVWTWPQPAIKGSLDVVYRILDSNGLPADGLALDVVPWMAAHAHGTSPTQVTSQGDGYYLVKPVYLYMSGEWQLRTTIAGAAGDSVTPLVEIP